MTAVKGNREYTIDPEQREQYAKDGFDIYDGEKKVQGGEGKAVSADAYQKAQAQIAGLKKRVAELEKEKKSPTETVAPPENK